MVDALVQGLIMPIVAAAVGESSFDSLTFTINDADFFYGTFLTQLVKFVLTAAALFFFVVKPVNAMLTRQGKTKAAE